ncbi:4-galactosyl-N-acetylglucosaminide 3-alpha-L-fucosyltransferase 9-like [Styela clava]
MGVTTRKQYRITALAVGMFMAVNLILLRSVILYKEKRVKYHKDHHVDKPVILIWNLPMGMENDYRVDEEECGEEIDCLLTYDQDLVNRSDAVVFHFDSASLNSMPKHRKSEQLYVWWSIEKNHKSNLKEFDNFFNLTMTYRRDSEIYAPYGSTNIILEELRNEKQFDLEELLQKKKKSRKMAAWAVSNCAVHRRMKLAKDMIAAGLDLDTFGQCFDDRDIGDEQNSESFYDTLSEYKFYLSFENGYHCKDYITENFWYNGLRSGAVPIVWGAEKKDIEAVAPKNSFIHVDDFKEVSDLVEYMIQLSVNDADYEKYLQWRKWVAIPQLAEDRFRISNGKKELHSFCKLCQVLHQQKTNAMNGEKKSMVVKSLREWWHTKENKECIFSDMLDFEMPQDGVRDFLMRIPQFRDNL